MGDELMVSYGVSFVWAEVMDEIGSTSFMEPVR
jgi:hypothetical protein